jgi:hypothetical protein
MELNHNAECDAKQARLKGESSTSQGGAGAEQGGGRRSKRKSQQQRDEDAAAEQAVKENEFAAAVAKQLNQASLHGMNTGSGNYAHKWDTPSKWTLSNLIIHIGRLDRGKRRGDVVGSGVEKMNREEMIEWIDVNWDVPKGVCRDVLPHEPTDEERWAAEYSIVEARVVSMIASSKTARTVDEWRAGVLTFTSDMMPYASWLNSQLAVWGRRATRDAGGIVWVQTHSDTSIRQTAKSA